MVFAPGVQLGRGVLEVIGGFSSRHPPGMLAELGREDDDVELSLDERITWNPLRATWLDSQSLAYTVASLVNQLFGKGKEPFWQQAYTNLVRWIIELNRVLPGGWVGLRIDQDVHQRQVPQRRRPASRMVQQSGRG